MKRKYFSGDTLAQALGEAARHFGVEPDEINYRQVDKRHGFLKIRRRFLIEVDPEQPRKERPAAERAEAPRRPERRPREEDADRERPAPVGDREPRAEAERPAPVEARERPEPPRGEEPAARERPAPVEARERPAPVEARERPEPPHREEPRARERPEGAGAGAREREVLPGGRSEPRERRAAAEETESRERRERRRRRSRRRRGRDEEGRPRRRQEEGDLVELPADPSAATEHYPRATGEEAEAAREALDLLFELSSLELEAEVLQGEDQLVVEVRGGDQDILLHDRGRLLLAIQHLLPRMIRGLVGHSVVCHVDSDNFREIREERLRDLAQRTAEEVRRRGQSETLEPMSPDERRIVHLTLTDDPAVDTRSHGSGLFKRVTVSPAQTHRRRPRGFDPYRR